MTKPKRGRAAAAETKATIDELADSLKPFLKNPFDDTASEAWYSALAEACPLWTLRRKAYGEPAPSIRLGIKTPFPVMERWSRDPETRFYEVVDTEDGPRLEWPGIDNAGEDVFWESEGPPAEEPDLLGLRVLVQQRLKFLKRMHFPPNIRARMRHGSGNEHHIARLIYETLRERIEAHQLASGKRREDEKEQLEETWKQIKGTPPKSVPNLKKTVTAMAKEGRLWVGAEAACQEERLREEAQVQLSDWYAPPDTRLPVLWLAFPFLHQGEVKFVRDRGNRMAPNPKEHGRRTPETPELTVVFLLDRRVLDFRSLSTVAEDSFGTEWQSSWSKALEKNPLVK